ncbi:MAG: hypothetical protein HYU36_01745 [Planctomycetes bacterium]|nr:hypothetical protein [Planctomycetota bacterium]
MVARGRVKNGIVVLESDSGLPEGTPVIVWPDAPLAHAAARTGEEDRMAEEEHRRLLEAIDRIAALPMEGSQEPFSGADHDKVLYGKP